MTHLIIPPRYELRADPALGLTRRHFRAAAASRLVVTRCPGCHEWSLAWFAPSLFWNAASSWPKTEPQGRRLPPPTRLM